MDSRTDWIGLDSRFSIGPLLASCHYRRSLGRCAFLFAHGQGGGPSHRSTDRPTARSRPLIHSSCAAVVMKGVECLQLSRAPMIDPALPLAVSHLFCSSCHSGLPPPPQLCLLLGATVHDRMTLSQKREEKKQSFVSLIAHGRLVSGH
jgi:hypothetical protein